MRTHAMKRNVLICAEENILIYDTELTDKEIKIWAKITGINPHDIFTITQNDLQYYCIDGRIWMNESKDKDVRELINRNINDLFKQLLTT